MKENRRPDGFYFIIYGKGASIDFHVCVCVCVCVCVIKNIIYKW